jgi:hypothetical protein
MATASRTGPARTGQGRPTPNLAWLTARDAVRRWGLPAAPAVALVTCVVLWTTGAVATAPAMAGAIVAILLLLLYLGERPLLARGAPPQVRLLGGVLAAVWLPLAYAPFHTRLFPGVPLVAAAAVSAQGSGLPLRIPAAGRRAVDVLLEGTLEAAPGGGPARPMHYRLTIADAAGTAQVLEGRFEERRHTQRVGRRGSTVVSQAHTAELRVVRNSSRQDLVVTALTLEPESAHPIRVSAFPHRLPAAPVLALVAGALLAGAVVFDRLPALASTDGALTLATAAVVGTAVIFWTSDIAHPEFSTLIGSVIFGGVLGFAGGAALWWVVKRLG